MIVLFNQLKRTRIIYSKHTLKTLHFLGLKPKVRNYITKKTLVPQLFQHRQVNYNLLPYLYYSLVPTHLALSELYSKIEKIHSNY